MSGYGANDPDLRHRLFGMLSGRMCDIQNHLALVGRQTAKERVASFLPMLLECQGSEGASVELPMSRHDIADYLNLTTETVSRILRLLKSKSIISASSNLHRLELHKIDTLPAMASCIG